MQEMQALVQIPFDVFCEIRSQINPYQQLDTGPLMVTSGVHPTLGAVVLIDSPLEGRVLAVSQSKVNIVGTIKS